MGEVEGVAQEAPPAAAGATRPVRVLVAPVAADGSSAAAGTVLPPAYSGVLYLQQRHDEWPPMRGRQQSEDGDDDPKKMRAKWFNDMRGWLMVVAVQVASVTYQAGLNPSDGKLSTKSKRSFYASEARVVALEVVVVLDMVGLMGAYWAGSTRREDQTTKYTLVLTAFVLFALYVVYMVQLLPKLWRLAAAAVRGLDDAALPVPSIKIDEARSLQRPLGDVGRSVPTPRRRGSRSARAAGTEPARMLSP
ncbi:embryogeneis transmembrane protein [Panicum miliaceum]|uniref:Embryogeneis transmembrane protein n=1 Tax=Panicum miliaceum TaxID=4540 RepID=A0A3L6S1U5_PANMI|nr:embryogeneis transmembrane protein [Panicum miliaceum]